MERVATLAAGALAATLLVSAVPLATTLQKGASAVYQRKVVLRSLDRSPVRGAVQITRIAGGGSSVHIVLRGLEQGTDCASFYGPGTDCEASAEVLGSAFTADAEGRAELRIAIETEIDEIGSVAIRRGPSYSTPLACGRMR